MPSYTFNAAKDIPSLTGKIVLVTGANAGIGNQTALDLAKHVPSQVWVGLRNAQAGNEAVEEIQAAAPPETIVKLLEMDLSSFASVKNAARRVCTGSDRLDMLVLNAGMMGGEPRLTQEGYEMNFGTNHIGHALLLKLLTLLLVTASHSRIALLIVHLPLGVEHRVIILSSANHKSGVLPDGGIEFASLKTTQAHYSGVARYCLSKLANAVYPAAVAKHYPQFTTVAINPGDVKTGLFSKGASGGGWLQKFLLWFVVPLVDSTTEEGAKNSLWAVTNTAVQNGAFFDPVGGTGGESNLVREGKLGEEL